MKKILICCFALLLLHGYTDAQAIKSYFNDSTQAAFLKKQTENIKNNIEFVFEGFFQRRDIYPRKDKNGKVFYSYCDILKITKVFRGNLKPGTVELAGITDMNGFISPSERESSIISDSTKYIFFCRAAGKDHPYDSKYDIYPVDNKTILTRDNTDIIRIFRIPGDHIFETKMRTKGDFYRYLSKLPNVKMPKLTEEDTVEVYHGKVTTSRLYGITKAAKDSLMAIRIAKRIHRADSIRRVKADSIGRIKSDSIALVKKKYN